MTTNTPNLGLFLYNATTDGSALFRTFRNDVAGSPATSNMSKIDAFSGSVSASLIALQSNPPIYYVSATDSGSGIYLASVLKILSYVPDMKIDLVLNNTNSGSLTYLGINALGNRALKKINGGGSPVNISAGDLKTNKDYLFRYNSSGSIWIMIGNTTIDGVSSSGSNGDIIYISGSNLADSGISFTSPCGVTILNSGSLQPSVVSSHNSNTTRYGVSTSGSYGHARTGSGVSSTNGIFSLNIASGSGLSLNSASSLSLSGNMDSGSYNVLQVNTLGIITSASPNMVGHNIKNSGSTTYPYQSVLKFNGLASIVKNSGLSTNVSLDSSVIISGSYGESIASTAFVYYNNSDNKWYNVDIDATSIACGYPRGIAKVSGSNGSYGDIVLLGRVEGFSNLIPNASVYASTVSGCVTCIKPTVSAGGNQQSIVLVGVADSGSSLIVDNQNISRFVKRSNLQSGSYMTISHYQDLPEQTREPFSYLSTTLISSAITNGSSNQTGSYDLQKEVTAGSVVVYSGSSNAGPLGNGGGTNYDIGQTFKVNNTAVLQQLSLFYGVSVGGVPSGCVIWSVYEAGLSSGSYIPIGSALISGSYNPPTTKVVSSINITNGIILDSSKYYALTLVTSASHATNNYWVVYDSASETSPNQYPYGNFIRSNNKGSWSALNRDLSLAVTTAPEASNSKIAQSFVVPSNISLYKTDLWLKKTGSPVQNLTLNIETNNAGSPSGSVIATTGSVLSSTITGSYNWVTFTNVSPVFVSSGSTYWLVLNTSASSLDLNNYVTLGCSGSTGYANGLLSVYNTGSWVFKSADSIFNIYEAGTTYDEPISIGSWSVGTNKILARFNDGSGYNPDTNTSFKNNHSASIDVTCEIRLP